ncbi:hypothetical protein, partial [Chamaesiphon sp. OTE_75_metabat_556]|uniref:hypothetical protein n=1 Tax=Chamaesiphon sp. OTE_75_metabat_556 TaxID=2964692 RepID=UPI00286B552E
CAGMSGCLKSQNLHWQPDRNADRHTHMAGKTSSSLDNRQAQFNYHQVYYQLGVQAFPIKDCSS